MLAKPPPLSLNAESGAPFNVEPMENIANIENPTVCFTRVVLVGLHALVTFS